MLATEVRERNLFVIRDQLCDLFVILKPFGIHRLFEFGPIH